MRKRKKAAAAMAIAAMMVLALGSGCQKKYEQIELSNAGSGIGEDPGQGGEAFEGGQADGSFGQETDLAGPETEGRAETSIREQNMVGQPAPVFKDVDETVYVSGDSVNLRASASTGSQVVAVFKKGE